MTQPLVWYKKYKFWLYLLQAMPFFWILGGLVFNILVLFPKYRQAQSELEVEFNRLDAPPQAQLREYLSRYTTDRAYITAHYLTAQDYQDVQKYYDTLLIQNGWQRFREEEYLTSYCKGSYTASIQPLNLHGYTLWFQSGIHSECGRGAGIDISYIIFFVLGCSTTFLIPYALVLGWASLRMTQNEYGQFKSGLIGGEPREIWRARVWAGGSFIAGVLGIFWSLYRILIYLMTP